MDPGQEKKGLALPTPVKTFVLSRWMSNYFEPQAFWETTARSNTRHFVGYCRAGRQDDRLVRTDLASCWLALPSKVSVRMKVRSPLLSRVALPAAGNSSPDYLVDRPAVLSFATLSTECDLRQVSKRVKFMYQGATAGEPMCQVSRP
ncbi:unnamed protein product [Polarella glacialis]|uniref:Uncharacterized protein n=1 Tax=Polarella glacialis TaxID=89957 RepID=A0A813F9I3_POLGL|nr:unnamed protein product [Polarella glacialis]